MLDSFGAGDCTGDTTMNPGWRVQSLGDTLEGKLRVEKTWLGWEPTTEQFHPLHSRPSVLSCLEPLHPTMAGIQKRKFDQLEEDDCSSSSLSSGDLSPSPPSSSASPAWTSEEEGLGDQPPQPDQDSSGIQSLMRESPVLGTPYHAPPTPSPHPLLLPSLRL